MASGPFRSVAHDVVWLEPIENALKVLCTSTGGLRGQEAAKRLKSHGYNRLEETPHRHIAGRLVQRFSNPLVLILLFAAVIAAFTQEHASFAIIATIVVISVLLDFIQEYRAETAAEALRRRVALRVTALRDDSIQEIPAVDLVPGDVVLLSAGNLVPADCRLIEARDLFVNEALLTGEPYPAEKHADGLGKIEGPLPDNGVFMGSSVISGSARALVVATGSLTRIGAIAGALRRDPLPTAFTLGIRSFGMLLLRLTMLLVLFVLLINLLFERPLLESFLFALALAVGLTPELLPMIVTVTLARGAVRMAREQVIVKRLSAIHDLGSMDVLCSDKTGTLTEAKIKLIREVDLRGKVRSDILTWAHVNAAFETGLKSPLDTAILEAAPEDLSDWCKLDEVPFDFERRRVSVLAKRGVRRFLIVKGAPEDVLSHSSSWEVADDNSVMRLDDEAMATACMTLGRLGDEGFRVLGIAWREVGPDRDHADISDESELTFAGFAAFLDPPKEDAQVAVQALVELGVAVKIITGDNERVTRHVCGALGVPVTGIINGPELAELTEEALAGRLEETNVFCRVSPPQKARIIHALRRQGHVVGYLGDGINDAPSLQAADVGLSVEGAADVARDAATMILLRHDFAVLAEGVREGRRTFANIMKYVMMGTSSNFGNMFSMAGAVLILPFMPMLPVQILLNNLLYDVSEITIPLDNVDEDMIAQPRHWDMGFVRDFMLVLGPVSSLFDFIGFGMLLWGFHASESSFQTGWFVMSIASQVLVIFLIRTRSLPWSSKPHGALLTSSLGVVILAVALPFTVLGPWFGFVPLPIDMLLALAAIVLVYLLTVEFVKRSFITRHP